MDPAFFLGMVLGEAVDPLVAIAGLLIGFMVGRWWLRILGACLFGAGISLVAAYVDPISNYYHAWGSLVASTIGGTLLWTVVGWGVRAAKEKLIRRQSSSGSA